MKKEMRILDQLIKDLEKLAEYWRDKSRCYPADSRPNDGCLVRAWAFEEAREMAEALRDFEENVENPLACALVRKIKRFCREK